MLKIGNMTIENPVFTAPLAGYSDNAYRAIAHAHGAGLTYSEMVSDKGLLHGNKKTRAMLRVSEDEGPVVIQLFGGDPDTLAHAVRIINEESDAVMIDLNLGCPVPKVVKGNGGASLMKDEALVARIVEAMVKETDKPITVKIRSGWDAGSINAGSLARKLEAAGASAIAVHPRTRVQMYRGKADWSIIKDVVDAVDIPVIGNGDIRTPEDAKRMLDETGCAAVMIGRGTFGNPWLIKQTVDYLTTGTYEKTVPLSTRLQTIKDHAERLIENKGEKLALLQLRTHVPWYLKGLPHASVVRQRVTKTTKKEALFDLLDEYFNQLMDDEKN